MAYDFNSLAKQAPEATNRDGFYTDFGDVDTSKLHQISELTEWMRTKGKGSDVREVIAQLFERTWLEGTKEGNANFEVAQARGGYDTLGNRLTDMTTKISGLAEGSPKGVYPNLAALQAAKPSGDSGIYVTSDNGHWYYYNNGWKDGGVYQATGIADGSITPEKTNFYTSTGNLFNVLKPNANLLSGELAVDSCDNVSIIKLNGKSSNLGATTVALMTGSSSTGTYITFDTSAQYTLTAKLLRGKCSDTRAVSLVVQRTDNNAPVASINMGNLLQNGGVRTETFAPAFKTAKVSLIFSAGAYDIDDCEILINITKGATSSIEPFGYRMSKSVDYYEQNKKIESMIKHDMYDYIVDKAGTGDFTTLTECVKQAKDMSVIYVKNGLYENEIVKAWRKTVFIIGESRDGVIITNSTGEYATPPIEMGTGLLRNLTIYAKDPGGVTPKNKCYALHSESSVYNYFKFELDNCNIISDWRQSWGMGMRGSMVYHAHNVNFDGGVYFHDNEHTDGTVQKIFFDNCNITREDNGAALILQDQQMPSADIDVRFNRCFVKSLQGSEIVFYKWDSSNNKVIHATGFADFPTWELNDFSWGNSEATLNA